MLIKSSDFKAKKILDKFLNYGKVKLRCEMRSLGKTIQNKNPKQKKVEKNKWAGGVGVYIPTNLSSRDKVSVCPPNKVSAGAKKFFAFSTSYNISYVNFLKYEKNS